MSWAPVTHTATGSHRTIPCFRQICSSVLGRAHGQPGPWAGHPGADGAFLASQGRCGSNGLLPPQR